MWAPSAVWRPGRSCFRLHLPCCCGLSALLDRSTQQALLEGFKLPADAELALADDDPRRELQLNIMVPAPQGSGSSSSSLSRPASLPASRLVRCSRRFGDPRDCCGGQPRTLCGCFADACAGGDSLGSGGWAALVMSAEMSFDMVWFPTLYENRPIRPCAGALEHNNTSIF